MGVHRKANSKRLLEELLYPSEQRKRIWGFQGHKLLNCWEKCSLFSLGGDWGGGLEGTFFKGKFIRQRTLSASVNSQLPGAQNNTYAKVVYLGAAYSDPLITIILFEKSIPFFLCTKFIFLGLQVCLWSTFPGLGYKLVYLYHLGLYPKPRELNPWEEV